MATERSTDVKVGLTVIVGLLILFLGITWAKGLNIFGAIESSSYIRFHEIGGLEVGDPVSISGVKRGRVDNIWTRATDVLVKITLPRDVVLHKDAIAKIMMLELMGGKKIEMSIGSLPPVRKESDTLDGYFSGDVGTLVEMVTGLSGTVTSLANNADTMFLSLNNFFRDNDLKGTVNKTLKDAQQTLEHFDVTAHKVNAMLDDNAGPIKRTLQQAESATKDLAEFLQTDRPIIHALLDTTSLVMHDARSLVLKATSVFANVDTLLEGASRNNTVLFKLTKDVAFGNRLDTLVTNLNKFIEQLRKQGLDANIRFFESSKPLP